jgi:hypothetical protein
MPTGMVVWTFSPLQVDFGNATESFCGVTLPSARFAVVTVAGASCAAVMLPGVSAAAGIVGNGRGDPPVRALKANVPLLPALSLHAPLTVASEIRVDVDRAPARHRDDVQAEADGAVGILRGHTHERRSLTRAALVVVAVDREQRALLRDVRGQVVAERLQLPAERAERLGSKWTRRQDEARRE